MELDSRADELERIGNLKLVICTGMIFGLKILENKKLSHQIHIWFGLLFVSQQLCVEMFHSSSVGNVNTPIRKLHPNPGQRGYLGVTDVNPFLKLFIIYTPTYIYIWMCMYT